MRESEASEMGTSRLFVTLISLTGSGYIGLYTLFPIIFPPIPEAVSLTKGKRHIICRKTVRSTIVSFTLERIKVR